MNDTVERLTLGVSSCLLGDKVRYDGEHKLDDYLSKTLEPHINWVKFCPEVEAGLGVPRPAMQLEYQKNRVRAIVIESPETDHTKALKSSFDDNKDRFEKINGYILKARSPSCGRDSAPVFKNGKEKGTTSGIFTHRLIKNFPDLPVIESEVLEDATRRENFFVRSYTFARWQAMETEDMKPDDLLSFHQQHQHLIACHNQCAEKELRRLAEKAKKKKLKTRASEYRSLLMKTLRVLTSRKDHLRTLEALAAQVESDLSKSDRKKLNQTISDFGDKKTSLEEPATLLHTLVSEIKKHPLQGDAYLNTYPVDLKLRKNLFPIKN